MASELAREIIDQSKSCDRASRAVITLEKYGLGGRGKLMITAPIVNAKLMIKLDFRNTQWSTPAPMWYGAKNNTDAAVACVEMFIRGGKNVFASMTTFSEDGYESLKWFEWPMSVSKVESEMGLTLTKKIHHILKLLLVD